MFADVPSGFASSGERVRRQLSRTSICASLTLLPASTLILPSLRDSASATNSIVFTDVTRAAGITSTSLASRDKKYIVESMSGGVAFFDFDNDGRLDIYLVNAYTVEAALAKRPRPPAALYRNRGNGTFEDVTLLSNQKLEFPL
ncbi:MAG TPA: VCBS repeat-containing protein [Blastocatellia bacterium]|nr:VCBS repeat-containing protein [Blastocatellia bacterium]